jgi:hypothetical protein
LSICSPGRGNDTSQIVVLQQALQINIEKTPQNKVCSHEN